MAEGAIRVEVIYALPERHWSAQVALAEGATVEQAIAASGLAAQVPGLVVDPKRLAIYGRPVMPQTLLRDGDRVEILRPLLADPKEVRRQRVERERHGGG
ncbi:RnfH family protein [Rehaibacterium terrae]|jgi:putative ubiquitin-RnfH superfamily antitoxin RatB of RatAB toxin-antitoxin module|uniref:UPF0125 protein HNQ58_000899 n=1 Tax=Rehaibacterium terrae TaxID=1341696 RepID=A0A7W7XYZ3_9GAMM|nr:RnfH family protein [Rehaibacterium terrae]MBB5015022.1 hypothetical protein [Rehaibacterium terrae]